MAFTLTVRDVKSQVNADGSLGQMVSVRFFARKDDGDLTGALNSGVEIPVGYPPAQIPWETITIADVETWVRDLYPDTAIEAHLDNQIAQAASLPLTDRKPWEEDESYDIWVVNKAYAIGDVASYITDSPFGGSTFVNYECVQAHTSQTQWTPPNTPALWTAYAGNQILEWVQPTGAQDAYDIGDQVYWDYVPNGLGTRLWESNTAANVWEPGVFGWDDLGPYTP